MFKEYEEALPGAADRILGMAEKEQEHRQQWEMRALGGEQRNFGRGQWLGFSISVISIGASVYLGMQNYLGLPILFGGSAVIGLVASSIKALRQRKSNSSDS